MTTATHPGSTTLPFWRRPRPAGTLCLVGGLVGIGQAAWMLGVDAAVSEDRFSYPFDAAGHTLAQLSFFVQHLPLVIGTLALAAVAPVARSRAVRLGLLSAVAGMVLLTVMELVAISAASVAVDSTHGTLVSSLYGVPTVLAGVGFTVLGVAWWRADPGAGRALPWVVAGVGIFVFVGLLPGLMAGYVVARLAIAAWMALFAVLGWHLRTSA